MIDKDGHGVIEFSPGYAVFNLDYVNDGDGELQRMLLFQSWHQTKAEAEQRVAERLGDSKDQESPFVILQMWG